MDKAALAAASLASTGGFPCPRRKGGSASFAGGDQPPLAALRRGEPEATRIGIPGTERFSSLR